MNNEQEISQNERLLFEISTYLRISAASAARTGACQVIDTYRKAIVYRNLDGTKTQAKLAGLAGVSQRMISNYVQEFVGAGLATPPSKFYPNYRALFTLEELGINISELKKPEEAKVKKQPPIAEEEKEE